MRTSTKAMLAVLAGALGSASPGGAADAGRNPNRYSVNGRFTFSVDAAFTSQTPVNSIGPSGAGGVDRFYDDGFVRVDISGNAGGSTWFWGYDDAVQLTGVGTAAGTLAFHSAASPADQFTLGSDEEVLPGIDFRYAREMGELSFAVLGQPRVARYGLSFGFGYTDLGLASRNTLTAPVTLTTDTYAIGALIPPAAPAAGTFAGPGGVIPDTPATRVVGPAAATADSRNKIDGRLYGATLGPFMEIPLSERLLAEFSVGLAVARADRRYTYRETVAISGIPTTLRSGRSEDADWLVGGSLNATLNYRATETLDCSLGFQYQNLGATTQNVNGRTARVDLGQALSVVFGLNWCF